MIARLVAAFLCTLVAILGPLGPVAPAHAAKCGGDFFAFLSEMGARPRPQASRER